MDKAKLLESLNHARDKYAKKYSKGAVLEGLQNMSNVRDLDDNAKLMQDLLKTVNSNVKVESEWRPQITTIKDLSTRILVEAENHNNKPNAFRLNLMPITLDMTHGKFQANRNGKVAIFEILYPNAKGKITIKVQVKGAKDKLVEVGLEDPEYLENIGVYIIRLIDECIAQSEEGQQEDLDNYLYGGGDYATPSSGLGIGSHAPNWQAMGESDAKRIAHLMEGQDDEDLEEDITDDLGKDEIDSLGGEGDSGGFNEDDFSASDGELGTEMGDFTSDFGGDFGGGSVGGGSDELDAGEINADDGEISMEDDVNYMTFRDKTDWLNSSLDTMQKLVSSSVASKMQDGSGVIMTSDEILNGTAGIKADSNYDVIDKFLKVYPELDNIDLTEEHMNLIEDKLSLDDGEFDSWLQQNLPEFSGQEEVNDTLNNEMFDDFEPMGGEGSLETENGDVPTPPIGDFDELSEKAMSENDEEITPELKDAEMEVGGKELDELPGLSEEKPKEKPFK